MKKILLLSFLLLSINSFAQIDLSVIAGFSSMSIASDDFEAESSASGINIGFGAKYLITDEASLIFQWKYFSSTIDFLKSNSYEDTENYTKVSLKNNGFRYELLGVYMFNENFGIITGPTVEYYFNMQEDENNNNIKDLKTSWSPIYSIGADIGAITEFNDLTFDLRYSYGISNPYANIISDDETVFKGHHNVISLGLTYYFMNY